MSTMRDFIDLYEAVIEKDAIKYFDGKDISHKDRVDRTVPVSLNGKAYNPVDPASFGVDQDMKATPNFTDGDKLREIDRLRKSVEVLQRLSHKAEIGLSNEDSKAIDKVIDDMNIKIDELSNNLVDIV